MLLRLRFYRPILALALTCGASRLAAGQDGSDADSASGSVSGSSFSPGPDGGMEAGSLPGTTWGSGGMGSLEEVVMRVTCPHGWAGKHDRRGLGCASHLRVATGVTSLRTVTARKDQPGEVS